MYGLHIAVVLGYIYCISCFTHDAIAKTDTRDTTGVISCWECPSCSSVNTISYSTVTCKSGEHCYIKKQVTHYRGSASTEIRVERGCSTVVWSNVSMLMEDGAVDVYAINCYVSSCNDYVI